RTDFADIFEVKGKRVLRKGNVTTQWNQETSELVSTYDHDGFMRFLSTHVTHSDSPANYSNGRISFLVDLGPRSTWHCCLPQLMNEPPGSKRGTHRWVALLGRPGTKFESDLREWKAATASITTSNEDVYRLFTQSVEDMAALRLPPEV